MKMLPALALALMLAATSAAAQVAADDRKSAPKGAQPATPTEAKKAADAKKAEARRKSEAKKAAAAKKAEAAKASAAKGDAAPVVTGTPNARVYKAGDPKVPVLRDREGKAIPTSPDAYDVSSAKK